MMKIYDQYEADGTVSDVQAAADIPIVKKTPGKSPRNVKPPITKRMDTIGVFTVTFCDLVNLVSLSTY